MTKTLTAAGTIGAALVVAAAMFACGGRTADLGGPGGGGSGSGGSGGSSGGSPFHGPGCMISDTCWSCYESNCPAINCLTTDCSAYVGCACACNPGDQQCANGCQSSLTPACDSCVQQVGMCGGVSACSSQCGSSSGTSSGGGSSTGGGSGRFGSSTGCSSSGGFGSSSGPGSSETCSGSGQQCANGGSLQFCQDFSGSTCTGANYQIVNGNSTEGFGCASCTDTTACQQEAMQACGQ